MKKILKNVDENEYRKWLTVNCNLDKMSDLKKGDCNNCPFKNVECRIESISTWVKHKNLYNDEFLKQTIDVPDYPFPNDFQKYDYHNFPLGKKKIVSFTDVINTKAYISIICTNAKELHLLNKEIKKRNLPWKIVDKFDKYECHTNRGEILEAGPTLFYGMVLILFEELDLDK